MSQHIQVCRPVLFFGTDRVHEWNNNFKKISESLAETKEHDFLAKISCV